MGFRGKFGGSRRERIVLLTAPVLRGILISLVVLLGRIKKTASSANWQLTSLAGRQLLRSPPPFGVLVRPINVLMCGCGTCAARTAGLLEFVVHFCH